MDQFDTILNIERRKITSRSLPILGRALSVFFLLLVFLHPFFLKDDFRWIMSFLALISSFCFLISLVYLQKKPDISDMGLTIYQSLYISVCVLNTFAHIILYKDIQQTTNVIFIFFIMTSIGLGQVQFFALLGLIDILWIILVWFYSVTGSDFIVHFTFAIAFGSVITPLLFLARLKLLKNSVYEILQRQLVEKELNLTNEQLKQLALFDPLTGIPNRRHLEEFFFATSARAKIDKMPLTIMVCDIDDFKLFNDNHGHQTGDKALVNVAQTLAECIRSHRDIAARFGGEEFVLLFPGMNEKEAGTVAGRVCEKVVDGSMEKLAITVSIGVYTFIPSESSTLSLVFQKADQALYHAKEQGKNCYVQAKAYVAED